MLASAVRPRIAWVPPRARSLGPECVDFWRDAGGELYEWQEQVIDGILGLDEDDRFVTGNDGICVARQNGKGVIEQAVEIYCAFELGYAVVMHTAHEFATSQEHQIRLEAFIQDCPHLHKLVKDKGGYVHANGQESIRLKSGARIIFKARTKGGGRGYSGDLLVWDEAMVLPAAVVGAQKPMLRASKAPHGPKTIYAGSAVDQEIQEHGQPFALIRRRGMEKSPGVSYFEWSAPYDHPDEMTEEILADRSWWVLANPSIPEGLIDIEHMAEEIESMVARTAAVELACVGDWPATDGSVNSIIDLKSWGELKDPASEIASNLFFAFDVSPDRRKATIAAAGKREDGLFHVEWVERFVGTEGLPGRLAELAETHKPDGVLCDDVGPAKSLVHDIELLGVTVQTLNTQEHQQACGTFFDAVEQKTLRHMGQTELLAAIRGADTRPLGDAWAWSRKNSTVDITPLVGVTFALYAAATQSVGGIAF